MSLLAQHKLQRTVFADPRIRKLTRRDSHARSRAGDFSLEFQGETVTVAVKSLQPGSVRANNGRFTGRCQVDARNRRMVKLPGSTELQTACFLAGEFDILAVNLFEFGHRWRFGFIRNHDLPGPAATPTTQPSASTCWQPAYPSHGRSTHLSTINHSTSWPRSYGTGAVEEPMTTTTQAPTGQADVRQAPPSFGSRPRTLESRTPPALKAWS